MTSRSEETCTTLFRDLILGALRVNDKVLNDIAAELCIRSNEMVGRYLISQALNRKNKPAHRVRLLHVVSRLGPITDSNDWLALLSLTKDRNPAVRESATRLIANMPNQQAGLEPSAEECSPQDLAMVEALPNLLMGGNLVSLAAGAD